MAVNVQPDQWALVTGASSGIGEAFAEKLASMKMNLVLSARRQERLEQLADRLTEKYGVQTQNIPLDLAEAGAANKMHAQIVENGITIDWVINNAGLGQVEAVSQSSMQRIQEIIQVNVTALTELTYLYLPEMLERQQGVIINVASVVGFMPVCFMGVYAASKAYVLNFTESLWAETRKTGVCVTALCPGTTRTEFFDQAGASNWLSTRPSQTPQDVVEFCLKKISPSRPHLVSGFANRLMVLMPRFFSRRLVARTTKQVFQSHIDNKQ